MMKKICIIGCALASISLAWSAPMEGAPQAECDGVKVATGPKGKGYSLLFADIKKVCGAKVNLCEVTTKGGLDNLNALSTKEADIGFVQVDTYNDMKNGDENIAALQAVEPLNWNYLHVITAANGFTVVGEKKYGFMKGDNKQIVINKFSDLRGQSVAVVGSAALMGRKLDKQLGYGMNIVDAKDDAEAFEWVRTGRVAAAMTLSGWPSGTIKNLTQQNGLTMVPFDAPINDPYKVRPLNYKGIAVYNSNTLGIPNMLVTRPFSGARAQNVAAIQSCINANMTELKEGNFQPGWNEIKNTSETYGIPKFIKK